MALARIVLVGPAARRDRPDEGGRGRTVVQLIVDILGFWDLDREALRLPRPAARLEHREDRHHRRPGRVGRVRRQPAVPARGRRLQSALQGRPRRHGGVHRPARRGLQGRPLQADAHRVLRASRRAPSRRAQPRRDREDRARWASRASIGFDVAHLPRAPHALHRRLPHRRRGDLQGHTLAGVKVDRDHRRTRDAGTSQGRSASRSCGGTSPSRSTKRGARRRRATSNTIDVRGLLAAELGKRENWSAQLPAGGEAMVDAGAASPASWPRCAHPLGRFVFVQQAVPLGLALERFGDGRRGWPEPVRRRGDSDGRRPAPCATSARPVREHFARAQFVEMTEEDRLTRPSFEEMDAGVEFSSAGVRRERAVRSGADMEYETGYLDLGSAPLQPDAPRQHAAAHRRWTTTWCRHLAAAGRGGARRRQRRRRAQPRGGRAEPIG